MRSVLLASCLILGFRESLPAQPRPAAPDYNLRTPFEADTLASASYEETIAYYEVLAKAFPRQCSIDSIGLTDAGLPLRLFTVWSGERTDPRQPDARTFFVNNGIHAGEPCGVDASMMLARGVLDGSLGIDLGPTTLAIVPAYNVGGMLNRGWPSRANQVGPRAHGFRGNARNLDLNRDFVKQDSRNARALTAALREMSPDVFVDTHTTNGADYAYHLTVIATQPEKLGPVLGPFLTDEMLPELYAGLEAAGHPVSPYVYSPGVPQEAGLYPFIESPRYSSGYAALLHSLSFITEAHMLKPFATRVRATEAFLQTALRFYLGHLDEIAAARQANRVAVVRDSVTLAWEVDTARADTVRFRGYAPVRAESAVTGGERLRYDRSRPQTVATPYYRYAKPKTRVTPPAAYVVPYAYGELLDKLGAGTSLRVDTVEAMTSRLLTTHIVEDYSTVETPYEGHYLHYGVRVRDTAYRVTLRPGDYVVSVTPDNARLLTAAFEPTAPDSYFAWGFFDSHLQQKEHYSAYVFEETAARMLQEDEALRDAFSRKRNAHGGFRQNRRAQLDWLYRRSAHYEHPMRLPVRRIENPPR